MEPYILEILVCPVCKAQLIEDPAAQTFVCLRDKLVFPVRQGVPILMVDEASPLDDVCDTP